MSGSISIPVLESGPPRVGFVSDVRGALAANAFPQELSGMYPVMDISTISHWLPYMDIRCRYMAIKLPHMEILPYVEVVSNLRWAYS